MHTYTVVVITLNLVSILFGIWLGIKILYQKRSTYDLLVVIKEWAELGKRAHEASLEQHKRTAVKTEEIKQQTQIIKDDVQKVPEKVVQRIAESDTPSQVIRREDVPADPWKPAAGGSGPTSGTS